MTTPIQHGFPDWNRSRAASDIQVVNSLGLNLTALTQTAVFFVGHMPYMYVRISSASSANVGISWFANQVATVSLFGDVITTARGGDGIQCIPVRGPYVRFTLERGAYPGTVNFQVFMAPVPFAVYSGTEGENVLIEAAPVIQAAATTVNYDAISTRGGWVHWTAFVDGAGLWRAHLFARAFSGTNYLLDTRTFTDPQPAGMVFAPALPLRVQTVNSDAVDRAVYISVTHHPFFP